MSLSRSTLTKRSGIAVVAITALMVLAVGCGGSSSKSESSSDATTATTAKSSSGGSGGGSLGSCVELAAKFEAASAKLDTMTSSEDVDLNEVYKTLDALTSEMPSAIKGDWKTVVDYFKQLSVALKGVDMNNMTDPAVMEKMATAMQGLDDPKYTTAIDNVEKFFSSNCPGFG